MRAKPDGFIAFNLPVFPGELFEAMNPVIDFQRDNALVAGDRLTSRQVALRAREGNSENEK